MQNVFHSIAFKTVAILVVSSVLLASIVSYLGDRAGREIAIQGVVAVAETQTAGTAERLVGPLRFKRLEDVDAILQDAIARSNLAVDTLVILPDGTVLGRSGSDMPQAELAILKSLAATTLETGAVARHASGLKISAPIQKSKNDPVLGAVATLWTSEPFLETIGTYRQLQVMGAVAALCALVLISAVTVRITVSTPLRCIEKRASEMADGDLAGDVPILGKHGEIGGLAASMEHLRVSLQSAESAAQDAFYESAGFRASSAAQLLCDEAFRIESFNTEFERFLATVGMDLPDLSGKSTAAFDLTALQPSNLAAANYPLRLEIPFKDRTLDITVTKVTREGEPRGYVIEWQDITEQKIREGILLALEEGQLRADFDGATELLLSATDRTYDVIGMNSGNKNADLENLITFESNQNPWSDLRQGIPYFGRFSLCGTDRASVIDGSISPIKDATGSTMRYVMLGNDITSAEEELARARDASEKLLASQNQVVTQLQSSMRALSSGNLAIRLEEAFSMDYEPLRADFNTAVASLDAAIAEVLKCRDQIGLDVNDVAHAVEDFAIRTERQAATLEETSTAVAMLSKSVENAAKDARQARDVVISARDEAAASSSVVSASISAMSEIEASSTKISSIISVIDDIAFQTNLLALNAGVEAARAGDAGRGFAVVASEVRELAQRSAAAASEISNLISTSGEQVKIGVSLVGKAGEALTSIADTIGSVADQVETISVSAEDQASGFDEINQAVRNLDQTTQENAAMFEETSASAKALLLQTEMLENATSAFSGSGNNRAPSDAAA